MSKGVDGVSAERASTAWPGPIGKPPRPHWWSIQPPPPSSPISARRAYLEVLGVFAAFFAAGIIAGGETLAGRYPPPRGSWAVFGPAAVSEIATAGLAVLIVALLSARRGITPRSLGLSWPRKADDKVAVGSAFRLGVWGMVALAIGGAITGAIATGKLGQPATQDNSYLLYATAASIAAGVVEETVVLAFVVTTLRQANRPLAEIVIVAVLLRCSYHDYYGPGVLGIAVWATVFVWLFLRTGSVLPLIIVHFLWDATIFWSQRWHALLAGRAIGAIVLLLAAVASWLADVARRRGDGQPPPGGWVTAPYTAWPHSAADPGQSGQLYRLCGTRPAKRVRPRQWPRPRRARPASPSHRWPGRWATPPPRPTRRPGQARLQATATAVGRRSLALLSRPGAALAGNRSAARPARRCARRGQDAAPQARALR